jgi:hypothetical protein
MDHPQARPHDGTASQPAQILNGGEIGETVTVTLTMADTLKNIKLMTRFCSHASHREGAQQ